MIINKYECKSCGMCCKKAPCDFIPDDLLKILKKYEMDFKEFFKRYLIILPTVSKSKADIILRLVPVMKKEGKRLDYYFVNQEYMNEISNEAECIFLEDNKCTVHDTKPLGGRIMICPKMAEGLSFQLTHEQYFVFWYNNQHIFYELSPELETLLKEARKLYEQANQYFTIAYQQGRNGSEDLMYKRCRQKADNIINNDIRKIVNVL